MAGKRFFLIAGGTVAGLGAVLSITPPQFGNASGVKLGTGTPLAGGTTSGGTTSGGTTSGGTTSGGGTSLSGGSTATPTPSAAPTVAGGGDEGTPITTPVRTPKAVHKARTVKKATHRATPKKTSSGSLPGTTPANTPTPARTPTPASTPKAATISGTFTGAAASTIYGPVQVQITIVNSVITKAVALTYPTGSFRDQQINQQAIPYLIQETLAAQSANIQGVGGASYTSQGWATSLQSAITKAGF